MEEPYHKDLLYIKMLILLLTLLDHTVQLKSLHHGLKKMDSDYICLNHQETTLDIAVALLEKVDKQLKLNLKELTLVNFPANKHSFIFAKCKDLINEYSLAKTHE